MHCAGLARIIHTNSLQAASMIIARMFCLVGTQLDWQWLKTPKSIFRHSSSMLNSVFSFIMVSIASFSKSSIYLRKEDIRMPSPMGRFTSSLCSKYYSEDKIVRNGFPHHCKHCISVQDKVRPCLRFYTCYAFHICIKTSSCISLENLPY